MAFVTPIYSKNFMADRGVTSGTVIIVPAGKTWILRCIDIYFGGSTTQMATYVMGTNGQTFYAKQWNTVAADWAGWRGRHVLQETEGFWVRSDDAVDVTVSGYELTNPA